MHMVASDGVANTEICALSVKLKSVMKLTVDMIQEFSLLCYLPKRHGKVSKEWFSPTRFRDKSVNSFASYILRMIPIMHLFWDSFKYRSMLPDECQCFEDLLHIAGLLKSGPRNIMGKIDALRRLIGRHHRLLSRLYGRYLKPEQHHLHHIIDHLLYLGILLSRFTAERKHRDLKRIGLHTFRNFEHSVTVDVLNEQCTS